ncbi:hypothetical protein [Paenirhodobacter sp.]|uniref:hypothetical protein n=1 Tax=Paenirhodobacter sp. TaxID=1965326 RepID=UPI003B41321A
MTRRLQFILLGLLAGLSFWQLSELPWEWRDDRAFAAVAVLALAFFGAALGMLGDLGGRRALLWAAAIALPAAGLTWLKSLGYSDAGQMLRAGHVAVALLVVTVLPVPFAIALATEGRSGWRNYAVLFSKSWTITVRYAAAWLFVGVVWLVLWLLSALLELVGIDQLGDFLARAPVAWLVSGAVLGLGLSVVVELSDMLSAALLLRLLRLLLPVVLLVEVVFVAVLPASGLGHLFGYLSPAGILIATALASILLIAIAVDQDDEEAAQAPVLTWSARGLAVLLPVLVGLAGWSLGLRVVQHGWTPDRVAATAVLGLIVGYAALYLGAVLAGRHWRAVIRRANVWMALVTLTVAVLWLTPLLSAEAISVRSQMARFEAGQTRAEQIPVWEFAHDWGVPGERAVEMLRQRAAQPGEEALAQRLAVLEGAVTDTNAPSASADARAKALRPVIRVLPEGEALPEELLQAIARVADPDWAARCAQTTPHGNPGCVVLIADFSPVQPGRDALFLRVEGFETLFAFHESGARWIPARPVFLGASGAPAGAALIDALIGGNGATEPARLQALPLGARQLTVLP